MCGCKQTLDEEGGAVVGADLATLPSMEALPSPLSSRAKPRDLQCAPTLAQRFALRLVSGPDTKHQSDSPRAQEIKTGGFLIRPSFDRS
jgi:hypothetical protein